MLRNVSLNYWFGNPPHEYGIATLLIPMNDSRERDRQERKSEATSSADTRERSSPQPQPETASLRLCLLRGRAGSLTDLHVRAPSPTRPAAVGRGHLRHIALPPRRIQRDPPSPGSHPARAATTLETGKRFPNVLPNNPKACSITGYTWSPSTRIRTRDTRILAVPTATHESHHGQSQLSDRIYALRSARVPP